jgi:glycosyltransferase involved in cell wall biosynthesis
VRQALVGFALAQLAALGALRGLLREIWRACRRKPSGSRAAMPAAPEGDIGPDVTPGDVLMVLGAPWSHPDYDRLAARMRGACGMRVALLVYDIIPLRRPEWCDRSLVRLFAAWFGAVLPLCDRIFAISRATAHDLEHYARENGLAIALPVRPIPIGTGFSAEPPPDAIPAERDPAPGTYALVVSTIEARKNHALLVRVWRRLLEEMPPAEVPTLVFAGRVGWMVGDLIQQLHNTEFLGGKVLIIDDASDARLAALYRGCRFTLFPSFYEGWGLPVTESLAFGKPCIIANTTSLPEAGGALARYFNPDNLDDALEVIREVIKDPAGLAAWEQRVVREFRPVSWDATAEALIEGLA